MPTTHLVEGPVGAGKTTYVEGLRHQHRAPSLILDAWFVQLFSPDRPADGLLPWYIERKERCLSQIWATASDILDAGHDVILELGLLEKSSRQRFYARVEDTGHPLKIYVLDASRDIRRERVRTRNREKGATFAMEVPDAFFEMASDRWEPFDDMEQELYDVRLITTG